MRHFFTFLFLLTYSGYVLAQAPTPIRAPNLSHIPLNQLTPQQPPTGAARLSAPLASTIRYVKAGASGTGASWSNASGNLQAIINTSAAGDQVWIAGGTYKPSTTGLSNARSATFTLKNGVSVLGGFTGAAGTEGNNTARTASPSSTTLSGDIGTIGDNSDNTYHVIYNNSNGLDNSAVLDGVTITGGNANSGTGGASRDDYGGGILNVSSSPTILNCLITQNSGDISGGMDTDFTTIATRVINCSFVNNTGSQTGGFYEERNTVGSILINCHFENNSGGNGGGFTTGDTPGGVSLTNCTFRTNSASAIYIQNSNLNLTNAILWNNRGVSAIQVASGSINVSYSALEAGATNYTDGGNNKRLDSSPFENATGPALKACATVIDAGNNAANATTTDVLGNTRKVRTIDMGAAEFGGSPTQPIAITSQSQSATTVCGAGNTGTFSIGFTGTNPVTVTLFREATQLRQTTGSSGVTSTSFESVPLETGTYRVVVTSSCNSVTATYAAITVNPLPSPYAVTGGGGYCTGGAGVMVGLSGSQTGVTYQLLLNGNTVGSPLAGTGNALTFGNRTTVGTYTVRATNAATGCQQTMTGSALVTANPLPTAYDVTGGGAYCAGGSGVSVNLSGSQTGVNYQLLRNTNPVGSSIAGTGSGLTFGNQMVGGSYTVRATSATTSCQQTMTGSALVTVNPLPTAGLTNNGPLSCTMTTVTLTASGGTSYTFTSPDGTVLAGDGNTRTVSSPGTYSVLVATASGCVSNTSTPVSSNTTTPTATLSASPSTTLTCALTSLTLTASGGDAYRFSGPGVVSQSGNTALVNASGLYSVSVTNAVSGCSSPATTEVFSNTSAPSVSINPASATLTCAVNSVVLTANTAVSSLTWSTGQTTPGISVSVAGTYSVTVTSANGCMALAQATVSGTTDAPAVPTLAASPSPTTTNQPITVTASGCPVGTINWTALGGTGQATGNTYTLSQPGNYTLSATCSFNGCTSSSSSPLSVQIRPGGFAITSVSPVSCQLLDAGRGQYEVRFTPQYADASGPISFSVVNELSPTTAPGPYALRLYSDNPMITLVANQSGSPEARFVYNWLTACSAGTQPNRPPVALSIPDQILPQGQAFSLELAAYITDPDGQPLTFSVEGLPADLTLSGSRISGTAATTGVSTVSIKALDPAGLQVTTQFQLTVTPVISTPAGFTIVGVTTVSCQTLSAGQRQVQFLPQYGGLTGQSVTFQVINELAPTQQAGPYTLNLYTDNPIISLQATQAGSASPAIFRYNWLAGCGATTNPTPVNRAPVVGSGVTNQTATLGQGYTQVIPVGTFTDPDGDALTLAATGLPAGLSFAGSTLTGTPATTGVSTVTLTARDPAGLEVSLSFTLTVLPTTTNPPSADFTITGVNTIQCEVLSAGQRRVSFTPQYSGVGGSPISFSVVNELNPTTAPGPYSLDLYTDNPVITLQAQQGATRASYRYEWLAACNAPGRQGAPELSNPLQVTVLGNPVIGQLVRVEVRGAEGQAVQLTLTDTQGRSLGSQRVERAASVEQQTLALPQGLATGLVLLQVSTLTQTQTVKLVKE
jgi:hypothetical protein